MIDWHLYKFILINKQNVNDTHLISFYNLSSATINPNIFKPGLKFIPLPRDISNQELANAYLKFEASTKWLRHFRHTRSSNTFEELEDINNFNPKLKFKGKPFTTCNILDKQDPTIPILKEIEKIIINYIQNNPIKKKFSNTSNELKKIIDQNPKIIFKPADKNLGIVALNLHDYNELVLEHLMNHNNYSTAASTKFEQKILYKKLILKYQRLTDKALNHKTFYQGFNDIELKFLKQHKKFQFPYFYILPKIHKNGPLKGRPISSATCFFNTPIAIILNEKLKHFHMDNNIILHSSQDFVSKSENYQFEEELYFLTADVESLYPSINTKLLISIFKNHKDLMHLTPLLEFILDNSYTSYNNKIFKQLNGITMGTNCAVALANIYLHFTLDGIFRHHMNTNNPYCCIIDARRYIDDIIITTTKDLLNKIEHLLEATKRVETLNIFLDWSKAKKEIDFLDLTMYQNQSNKKICFKIFHKSIHRFNYLDFRTYHPKHTLSGFIKGELTRYARLSSTKLHYEIIKSNFKLRLLRRNYPKKFLDKIFNEHYWNIRYQEKKEHRKIIPFIIPNTERSNIRKFYREFNLHARKLCQFTNGKSPLIIFTKSKSIQNIICNSKLTKLQSDLLDNITNST